MKIQQLLFLLLFLQASCASFDVENVTADICNCNADLVKVNEEIKNKVTANSQKEVMALFVQAGKVHEQTKKCILSLSNQHGKLTQKQYASILSKLRADCQEAIEPFQKSGWYQKKE